MVIARKTLTSSPQNSPVNMTGLLSLPVEVFARIQEELVAETRLITHEDVRANETHLDATDGRFTHRVDVLRPLTQVCHALRNMYFGEVYEHLEAWVIRSKVQPWYKQICNRLTRISESLCCAHEPAFAQHVR